MRLVYYIAYNPITKTYVGVKKRAYKERLEYLATLIDYHKNRGDFWRSGHTYDLTFSSEVLPELIKVFNNRITDIKYYASKKAQEAVAFFVVPDRISSNFPEEYANFKYVVVIFYIPEIKDLRDAEKIYLYDNKNDALEDYLAEVANLRMIDKYYRGGDDSEPPSGSPKVSGILRKLRRSSLLYRPSKFRRVSSDLGRLERSGISSGSSWDFLL